MKIKELQKTVNIAWSPLPQHPIYLAAGTAAQQLDSNVNSTLEIFSTNFSDPSYDLELKASLPSQYRFQKLIWSPTGFGSTHRNGLIVGGCEGGHVMIYSPSKMLANEDGLIARQDKHTGPVSGLDFNPFQTNLLASCASESEIFIWDLNNTTTHMNPGTKTQPFEDVKNVAWNRQVQHILASVFSSRCVIWDLRKSEQIIKLSDTQSRVRWHAIQWHPEVATQVWLASEDDQAPVVQLWDLRYATAPAKTMQIHQRGILGMSWCPRDIDLMVSCGKDNRIFCWNPNTQAAEGEILSEVATTATWYSDVQWCPRNPALIASSSLDGNVSIYSLFGGVQQQVQTANKIADSFPGMDQFAQAPMPQQTAPVVYQDLKYAPKWIKKPCGVTFGFGGKLVSFNNKSKTINISQVTTEPVLVEKAKALEKSLSEANFVEYCRQKADEMTDQNGRYLWYFIKANFERNPKEEILNLLGFNKEDIDGKFSKYLPEEETNQQEQQDVEFLSNRMAQLAHSDSTDVECDQSTDGSTNSYTQPFDNNNTVFDGLAAAQKDVNSEDVQKPLPQFKIPSGDHADSLITEAILTGNLEAAVHLCLNSKRTAEAFIIASTAGIEFLTKIQNNYLQEQQNELSNVISALITRDWLDFVTRCTIDSWKEALVAALRHSERRVVDICEKLGDRLLNESSSSSNIEHTRNAMLCYICAGNIDKLVLAWYQLKQLENQNSNYKLSTEELQELAEIVMLMNKSLEEQGIAVELNTKVADFIKEYGGLLVAQGAFTAALAYIMEIKATAQHPDLDDLKQRICSIVQPTQAKQTQMPMQQQNMYQRQQQPRGSFSQVPNNSNMGGYMGTGASAAMPPLVPNPYAPPPPSSTNNWNSNPVNNPMTSPFASQPLPATNSAPTVPPAIFNPGSAIPANIKPPSVNENLSQPPRPLSTASSQGGTTSGTGLSSRNKYVLDPSVAPTGGPMGGYGNTYNPAPIPQSAMPPNSFNTTPFNANPISAPAPSIMQPTFNPTPFANNTYMPGVAPIETTQAAVPPPPTIQRNPTPPPGWNDPPALKTPRQPKKVETVAAAAPITHPLFGVDPNQNQNGYMDPNAHYQQQPGMPGMPPPPISQAGPQQQTNLLNPTQPPMMGTTGSYYNPATQIQNNNLPNQPMNMNFQTSAIATQQPPQTQSWQNNAAQQGMMGYPDQSSNKPQQSQMSHRQPEPPKEKPPLPEEYIYLQTVLEELKTNCLNTANDPRTKRKFVDVNKRLENLYDCLRDGRLHPATIDALNQIIQYLQIGDYGNALQVHTQIAFGSDFSQCAGFMPGLKVLIQSANELQVYLR